MNAITTHKKTDFGDVWYVNSTDGSQWGYVSPVTRIVKAQSEKYRTRKK